MDRQTVLRIATLQIAAFTIGIDFTGALLLVPEIEKEFDADITTTQWVLSLYALTFSVFMIAGGRLGDMYGRRRYLLFGSAIFLVATLACLLAPSAGWLIGARAVQGIGAALIWPSMLALAAYIAGPEKRSFVIGLILAGVTTGNVIGPLISGVVVWLGDWRLFFAVNLVLAGSAALLVMRVLPREPPGQSDERIDYAGIVVLAGAIIALMYGLDVGQDLGFDSAPILGLFALSAILFVAFPFIETKPSDPMVPPALMRNREFMLALTANALVVPAIFISFLYIPQYFQKVLGWSVLQSSIGMMPLMVLLAVGSIFSGGIYDKVGPKVLLLSGYVLVSLGTGSMLLPDLSWGYYAVLPALLLIGFGAAIAIGSAGTAAVSAVRQERAGLAGALSFTVHLAYGAIGVAVATAIMYASSLAAVGRGLARDGISMSLADQTRINAAVPGSDIVRGILAGYDAGTSAKIHEILTASFTKGLGNAFWVAFVSAVLGVLAVIVIDEQKLKSVSEQTGSEKP